MAANQTIDFKDPLTQTILGASHIGKHASFSQTAVFEKALLQGP